ncbi:MAG: fatty acid desaturase [candidate division KSB1 bacterium]|jgi:beta-carotene ketolase (CrtW type)|nr:fatty acid desaturase [candidate division KSB1 bacterium]
MKSKKQTFVSFSVALTVIAVWFFSLWLLLGLELATLQVYLIPFLILWQTFLYTGLFITAHDAMHGQVVPSNRRWNNATGAVITFLYALFSFRNLLDKHWDHHKYPASNGDPDYHDGKHSGFFAWYFRFMRNYIQWRQIVGMAIIYNVLLHILKIPNLNIILFWVIPALLSTVQLFYFGTFLPHRDTSTPFADRHRARSLTMPVWISFFSCYHFGGFHHEHHLHPSVAWFDLPKHKR